MAELINKVDSGEIAYSFTWKGSTCDIYMESKRESFINFDLKVYCYIHGCILDDLYFAFGSKLDLLKNIDHDIYLKWITGKFINAIKGFIDKH